MSRKETVQISCPNCGYSFQKDVWKLINVDTEPYLKTALVTGLLNLTRCPKCNHEYFLALPLVYHEARTKRVWCYIPAEMGKPSERQLLAVSMVEELRQDLNAMLRKFGEDLTTTQTETVLSYLQSPRIFAEIDDMVKEIRPVENTASISAEDDATAQLLIALESLQKVDSDETFVAALEAHSIFSSPATPAHLRGLSELAESHGDSEKAEYFSSLAEMLERARGIDAEADELHNAIAALAETSSEAELDAVFLAHPILARSESIEQLRHAAAGIDDENTAQLYSDVADMLEERQISESPPGFDEALQAFVEADSPEEHLALIKSYPILYSPEAIAHLRQRAEMAYQAEEEDAAELFEKLAEMMERLRNVEIDEDAAGR
jgi:2-oxo-4-hydroxy-4-carboxy--5-ureidoimidazoline (OHCU) decarboxylase